jgi:plasmid stability protein
MTTQIVTLALPQSLYQKLKARAEQTHRSVEDEALDVLTTSVPIVDELSIDLEAAISPLSLLDDEELWRAARSSFSVEAAQQLEELNLKRQREGLTEAEAQIAAALVRQYERAMLVRAQAAALLKQRSYDVSSLISKP